MFEVFGTVVDLRMAMVVSVWNAVLSDARDEEEEVGQMVRAVGLEVDIVPDIDKAQP